MTSSLREQVIRTGWPGWFVLALAVGIGAGANVRAERYLKIEQAQKLCFPEADRFESHVLRFSASQAKVIGRDSGVKVLNKGNRFWVALAGTNTLGVLVVDYVLGKHEIIDYVVAMAPEGRVKQVEILEYRESHGGEIRNKRWLRQFTGQGPKARLKINDDIYNISGATISCRHVTEGVKRVLVTFDVAIRPQLPSLSMQDIRSDAAD